MRSKIFTRTIGYWPLQETSGQALDYSGNENHASSTNVSGYGVSGPLGGTSIDFNGSGDYIGLGNPSAKLDADIWTLSAWIKTNISGSQTVLQKRYTDNPDVNYTLSFDSSGKPYVNHTVGGTYVSAKAESTIATGVWHHLVGVNNGSDLKMFVDGVKVNTTSGGGISDQGSSQTMKLGKQEVSGSPDYFDGKIAHVRVWDYPLPEASIRALYNASRGGFAESSRKTS